ncbi:MAG: hypothetical protein QXV22_05440, partial [Thermoplasmataceae archaeon]
DATMFSMVIFSLSLIYNPFLHYIRGVFKGALDCLVQACNPKRCGYVTLNKTYQGHDDLFSK